MRTEKWDMYMDTLQGHPSVCQTGHTPESIKSTIEYIPPDKFPRLLDIGVGEGYETKLLRDLGYDVIGIIMGQINLEFAYEHYPDITFVEDDMHDLPFPSESFDAVYMNHTFEHSYAPFIFLLELYCVLKLHGRVLIIIPSFKEITDPTIGNEGRLSHHHPNVLCYNLFKQMFESAGFKIIRSTKIDNIPYFDNPYLLEKQDLSYLHSDVQTVIRRRRDIFG